MSIRPPALDDRRYEDLVAELVERIPAHTPEWTNPRAGDPGRTLIELFAWLGDALLYRANLIPERQRIAFLRLLGQPLQPARPARGLITVSLKEGESPEAFAIRPLATLAGPVSFEVRSEFTVLPLTAAAYYKRRASAGEVADEVLNALSEFHADGNAVEGYTTTPLFPDGRPAPDGFDVFADTADRSLWLALLAPKAPSPAEQAGWNDDTRTAIGDGRRLLNIGFVPALPTADPLAPITTRAAVPHVWEITAKTTAQPIDEDHPWRPEYVALDRIADTTAGLTRTGTLRLALPRGAIIHAPENDVRADPDAGVGPRPPRLDDAALASRLIAWLRLRAEPAPPTSSPVPEFNTGQGAESLQSSQTGAVATAREVEHLRVVWTGVNAVEAEQLITQTNRIVGESTGAADQELQLPATGIEPETLRLEVEEANGWTPWQRIDDLGALDRDAAASRDAHAFELDPEAGIVRFGDGLRGMIPPAGRRVRAALLRSGGGAAGNLPAGTLKAITATTITNTAAGRFLTVAQPLPFTGGSEAETLAGAEKRIPARLRHRERAVTADDYRVLAGETPGVSVGRVELLPRFKPQQRHDDIPGVVTVMVLPARPIAPAPNPRADRPFLEAVHAWLDARRPLGTELYVIGCEYVPIAVSVAVIVEEDAPTDTTLQAVKDALIRVLWPLPGSEFDRQKGWPLGREVSNRELAVEVARVPGISEVAGLNLFKKKTTDLNVWEALGDARDGREQNLRLERWQLPELAAVVVIVGDSAPLSVAESNGGEGSDGTGGGPVPVAVPVVPDIC
ncbi:MAG TPA: putative baseplate assembly protein [Chthoniobacterales bacterium]|nr:putative baseplate assembly protein [Chthoniobacterales bacterium]